MEVITLKKEIPLSEFKNECVDVKRFLASCEACRGYGRTWACPPYDFDVIKIWESYDSILLYAKKVCFSKEETQMELNESDDRYDSILKPIKSELLCELRELESRNPDSLMLSAGGCDECAACGRKEGNPCVKPHLMRYSVESIGGDVIKALKRYFDEDVVWGENGRLPDHFILLGGLLIRNPR